MAKKSKRKNIILTNLPAAIALIIMAAALKITLKFSFFISLVVLIVVYLILGVLIELIIDKIDTKKKKEDLFKQYAEGKGGQLPVSEDEPEEDEIEYEIKPKKEAGEISGKKRRKVSMESLYETEEEESPAFTRQNESADQESETDEEETIPEKGIAASERSESESETEITFPEFLADGEEDIAFSGESALEVSDETLKEEDIALSVENALEVSGETLKEEDIAFSDENALEVSGETSDADDEIESSSNEGGPAELSGEDSNTDGDFLNIRISDLSDESETVTKPDGPLPELFEKKFVEIEAEDIAPSTDSFEEDPNVQEETGAEPDAETQEAVDSSNKDLEGEVTAPEEIEVEPISDETLDKKEVPIELPAEDSTELPDEIIAPSDDEGLIEALKDVGAIQEEPKEDIPQEEVEARRSLFDEADDFDAGFAERVKNNTSLIFGSVPDTDDDLDYIPVSDVEEPPVMAQKGKVKVDAKKIDDLYSFKKGKAGEKFFGRRKK